MDIMCWYELVEDYIISLILHLFSQILTNVLLERRHVNSIQHAKMFLGTIFVHAILDIREMGKQQDAQVSTK